MSDVLLIEPCNFEDFPVGGQLSFAKQMMKAFGSRLALVGITTDHTPIGQWIRKNFDGVEYKFLAVGRIISSEHKPIIPRRLTAYLKIKKHRKQILSLGIRSFFAQAPEVLLAVQDWDWTSICYYFPGLNNPLTMPRYRWSKPFMKLFRKKLISSLEKVDVLLAAADDKSIDGFVARTGGRVQRDRIIKFPTRVDTSLFRPLSKVQVRRELGINEDSFVIVSCGRISVIKGWPLLVNAFGILCQRDNNSQLIFVGDGEDRRELQNLITERGLSAKARITGFQPSTQVVKYLNAADVVAVSSHHEGWSIALVEALACGKAVVSTDVSGARDMIVSGRNGFIVGERQPEKFADAIARALELKNAEQISRTIAEEYALNNLAADIGSLWTPLA